MSDTVDDERLGVLLRTGVAGPVRGEGELRALHMLREHVLGLLDDALTRGGLDALLVKGAAIAPHYPTPHRRPMGDIDLVVRPEALDEVRRRLAEAGFRDVGPEDRPRSERFLEVSLRAPPPASVMVELHTGLDKVAPREQLTRELFERSHAAPGRRALRVPALDDQALLTVLHLANDELGHGAGFADLEVLFDAGVSLADLLARARAHGATTACYVVLRAYASLAARPLDRATIARIAPAPWRRRALDRLMPLGAPSHPLRDRSSGWRWLLGQALVRDDVAAFSRGVAQYAVARAIERVAAPARRGRRAG